MELRPQSVNCQGNVGIVRTRDNCLALKQLSDFDESESRLRQSPSLAGAAASARSG